MPFIRFHRRAALRPTLGPDERRFALGTRSLADLVAPAAVEVARNHLRLDHQYARTLVLTGYPRTVSPGCVTATSIFCGGISISGRTYVTTY